MEANNKKIIMKGQTFGDWYVLEDLPGGKCLCRCSCEAHTERIVISRSLRTGKSTSCGHKNIQDLTKEPPGTFGEWTPIKYIGNGDWECVCSCGEEKRVKTAHLLSGASKSCGHNTTKFQDLTGKTFGDWVVLEYRGNSKYLCKCTACNQTERLVDANSLRRGTSTNCGCKNKLDLIGKTFGELTVIAKKEGGSWLCKCSCKEQKEVTVGAYSLLNGLIKSCGCRKAEYKTETMLERYGETTASRIENPRSLEAIKAVSSKEELLKVIDNCESIYGDKPTIGDLVSQLEITRSHILKNIRKYGLEEHVKIGVYGQMEESIARLIESWGITIERHNKSILHGLELDIYIPSKRIAIEFNGTYWHSDKSKSKTYHQEKTIACAKQHIRLIHIFEYEWLNEDTQIKIIDMLKRILVPHENQIIYARKTKLVKLENSAISEFIDKNHLQNHVNSSINYGLLYNNDLIAVMTFGKPRFTKDNTEYELLRLAYKSGIVVVGGSSKLFKAFLNEYNPSSIVSYCDIAKFSGEVYVALGFKAAANPFTDPNYVWVSKDQETVLKRYQTMKHKLLAKGIGNELMTEREIMESLNYTRVYDCGNLKVYMEQYR